MEHTVIVCVCARANIWVAFKENLEARVLLPFM